MTKMIIYAVWGIFLLSLYGWSAAYGYSPFGDGENVSSDNGNRAGGGVFVGGYRSGPRHK